MRKYIISAVGLIVVVSLFFIQTDFWGGNGGSLNNGSATENALSNPTSEVIGTQQKTSHQNSLLKNNTSEFLGYIVNVNVGMTNSDIEETGGNSSGTKASFELVFNHPFESGTAKQALVRNFIQETANGPYKVDQMGFLYDLEQPQVYQNLDLLGLPKEHTLVMLPYILNAISYHSETTPLILTTPTMKTEYSYQRLDNKKLLRELIDYQDGPSVVYSANSPQVAYSETWQADLSEDKFIERVATKSAIQALFTNVNDGEDLSIEQHIRLTMKRFYPESADFTQGLFIANANRSIDILLAGSDLKEPENDEEMLLLLDKVTETLSQAEAEMLGRYLITNKSISEVKDLLADEALDPFNKQALLMALQEANQPESETYLASIILDASVADRYRAAGMVNIALIKDATHVSYDALHGVMYKQEAPLLIETALYNIGNISRNQSLIAPDGVKEIMSILEKTQDDSRERFIALQAAANANNDAFTETFVSSLSANTPRERLAAVEGALYRPNAKSQAVEHLLLKETSPMVFAAAERYYRRVEPSFYEVIKFYERLKSENDENMQVALGKVLLSNRAQKERMQQKLEELIPVKPGIAKLLSGSSDG
ncbi:hypothetical protein CS022_05535 [Veronia nyctiphanis]|uniref:Uncharacterized protein n=1 Tax=Veronia nyctiphanis TaxID=1278244 RepID=A0A4Q0YS96_9GAMM|nr:hypothetical protein [Veronia nyctiphanis]RXJ74097.1 hypothetical protein CS022_05535 [Veronia nyctiphanis]